MEDLLNWASAVLDNGFVRIVVAIILLYIVRYFVHGFIGRLIQRAVRGHLHGSVKEEEQREETLTSVFRTLATVILWVLVAIFILQEIGVNLAALATGAGLLGIVVGLGAQSVIKDFLSGMFIILENQYRIGDVVTIGGHSGVVEEITIRMTKLRDMSKNVYFIPNGNITTVTNMTLEHSGVVIDVSVSYDTDISAAEKLLDEVGAAMAEDVNWKDMILEPVQFLRVEKLGDSSIDLRVVGKVVPMQQWAVAGEYRKRIKKMFDTHKIEIPFPQVVVHQSQPEKK